MKDLTPKCYLLFIYSFLLLTSLSFADETIKVLLLETPESPIIAKDAERVRNLKGEVFFNGHSYSGSIDVRRDKNGLYFINELPIEDYVEGVVATECGKDWPIEALKAQVVISRTYAIYQKSLNAEKDYHITSTVLHQAYNGENTNKTITQAVRETAGEILTYEGNPIEAFYHSTCVGNTELPEDVWGKTCPYLKSVPCMGENSPYEHWIRRFSLAYLEKVLGLKGIKAVSITSFTSTGRVKTLKFIAEDRELDIKAVDLRKLLGYKELPSTQFSIAMTDGEVICEGSGYGHGVGASQWGMLELARKGKDYREVLKHYYPETILQKRQ